MSSSSKALETRDNGLLASRLKFGEATLTLGVVDDLFSTGATKSRGLALSIPSIIARSSASRYAVYIMLCF